MIITPVIGIPNYLWKRQAVKFAKKNPFIIKIKAKDLCYDCDRHRELLCFFDGKNENYLHTQYYKYQLSVGRKKKTIIRKIEKVKLLYYKIRNGKYESDDYPIITIDGCRLDGSHRLVIYLHLGYEETDINVFDYKTHFPVSEYKEIIRKNKEYRKKLYKF